MLVKVTMYNIRNVAIRWQIHDFLSNGSSNDCSLLHRLRDICKNKKNANTLTLKMKIKVKEKYRTCAIQLEMSESI